MTRLEPLDNNKIAPVDFEAPTGHQEVERFKVTRAHILLLLLGLLSLLFILFITVARSIQVSAITPVLSNPDKFIAQPASISLDAVVKLPLGNRVLVLPGEHQVSVEADGYEPLQQTLSISGERHQQFELVLTRLPGKLKVNLLGDVDTQATVAIDGTPAGSLPGLIENVAAGEHKVTVDAPLFRPATQTLLVEGKGKTQELNVSLQPAWAEYSFSSVPEGANLLVDGQLAGTTPITLKLEEGLRQISLTASGYKQFEQEIGVVAQQNLVIPDIELIPADGRIDVVTKPENAAVILNGQYKGNSPMTLTVEPDKQLQLQVYKAGFKLHQQSLSLVPDQKEVKDVSLLPDLITVQVSVSPSDASVYVDGTKRGQGSQTLTLNTLPHSISVRKAGYVTQNKEIIPTRKSKQIVSVKLLTEEQDYWAQIPDTYTNALGHSMKLFKAPGKVSMGSSRREAGRRANEIQFNAELTKPFYVALHETTNKQFRAFKATHNAGNYKQKSLDANKAPAANVSWQQAALYCNWLSEREKLDPFYQTKSGYVSGNNPDANGYRLLTEAEWAWLARNENGGVKVYPWGNSAAPSGAKPVENFADVKAADIIAFTLAGYDDGYRGPAPVGRFQQNHRGLFDIGGNVSEWVNDWYSAKGSTELGDSSSLKDPLGPDIGEFHVIRGASWAKGHLPQLRLAYRDYGAKGKHDVGFRVARYAGLTKGR